MTVVVPGRRLASSSPIVVAGVVFSVVTLAWVGAHGLGAHQAGLAAAFGSLIFLGELARVLLPGDREIAPVAVAGAIGYALTFDWGGTPTHPPVMSVTAVTVLACAAGAVLHGAVGRPTGVEALAIRVMTIGATAGLFQTFNARGHIRSADDVGLVFVMTGIVAVSGILVTMLTAANHSFRHGTPFPAAVGDELRAVAGIGSAIGATGILIALAMPQMGLWALPTLSLPLLVAQFSLRRFSGIRATYRQTIRALSKVTEVGGYVTPGHSRRVAALAVATGREIGMTESELLDLEYAALMHDIGQLSLAEPIPGGSTLTVPPVERYRIASLGAEVIRSAGALERVATIVARQADPYRRNRRPPDPTLPLESRIVKAASAYDDIVAATPDDPRVRADALERLRLGMAYEYDPRVVEALARVVARLPYGVSPALAG